MLTPVFSIVIPTYNSALVLESCLESILGQSYPHYEILIIDGLSTDETIGIVKANESSFKNMRWVSEKDNGIYDAMNKGILLAKGQWLYFMGSDDKFYSPNVLQQIANICMLDMSLDVVYGNIISDSYGGIYDGVFTNQKILNQNICHQSIFLNKRVFSIADNYNVKYHSHADWDHNMKWFLSKKIRKQFVDLIIADYGAGGYSSKNGDVLFAQYKVLNYIRYGYKTIPFSFKYELLKNEIKGSLKSGKYRWLFEVLRHLQYVFI